MRDYSRLVDCLYEYMCRGVRVRGNIDPKYVTREYLMQVAPLVWCRLTTLNDIYNFDYLFNDDIPVYQGSDILPAPERGRPVSDYPSRGNTP